MTTGDILLCDLSPTSGREQGGRRPVVVVSHRRFAVIPGLFLAVPLTSVYRGLPHHVEIPVDATTGLTRVSYAMTEQVRALSEGRVRLEIGATAEDHFAEISRYVHRFIA